MKDQQNTGRTRIARIADETLAVLKEWKACQDSMHNAYGDEWINTGYVFTQDDGNPISPDSLTSWLSKFSKEKICRTSTLTHSGTRRHQL